MQSSGQKTKTKLTCGRSAKKKKTTSENSTKQKSSKAKGKKRKRSKKPKDDVDGGVASQGSSKVNSNDCTRDLEQMRREKTELERQREREARERERLEEELRRLREDKGLSERMESCSDLGEEGREGREGRVTGDDCHRQGSRRGDSIAVDKGRKSHWRNEDIAERLRYTGINILIR